MINKKRCEKIFFMLILALIGSCFALPPVKQITQTDINATITLQELTTQDAFVLKGLGVSKDLYLPILSDWDVENITLHLNVFRDNLVYKNFSITAFIKDYPISSIDLTSAINKTNNWNIVIPSQYITTPLITVSFRRNVSEGGITCDNLSDPSTWAGFTGDSTVSYRYKELPYQSNLSIFPAPFVNEASLYKDHALILLPDQFDTDLLKATYYVANTLYRRQSWRGLDLVGTTDKQITDDMKAKNNIILIGAGNQIKSIIAQADVPLKMNADGMFVDANNKVFPDTTGIVMELTSPWNPHHAILVVTGNAITAVIKATEALRDKRFGRSVIYKKYALIDFATIESNKPINWDNVSLGEMGYKNTVVYGSGDEPIKYDINFPLNKSPTSMDMTLHYSVSPLISARESSFLSLKVNNFPITGEKINDNQARKTAWKFHINGDNLLPGKNLFEFDFHLKFYNRDCNPNDWSLVWGAIYADSQMNVKFDKNETGLTFSDFNLLDQNVSVFLPKKQSIFSGVQLIDLIINMAKNISHVGQFNMYYDDAEIAKVAKYNNVIYIGNMTDNSTLNSLRHHFPMCYLNNKIVVKPSIMPYFHMSDETPISLIELINSPYDKSQEFLLITANAIDGYHLAIDTFFNPNKNQYLRGNVVFVYQDGTFTSIDTNRLEIKSLNEQVTQGLKKSVFLGAIVFATIFFGGIILMIGYRRLKHYFFGNKVDKE